MKRLIAAAVLGTALTSPAFAQFAVPNLQFYGWDIGHENITPPTHAHAVPGRVAPRAPRPRHGAYGRHDHLIGHDAPHRAFGAAHGQPN
jgi:hypothetical protein